MATRRILIVAGEASSDAHGAGLLAALRARGERVAAYGIGGPALAAQGMELIAHADELAVVGLFEALGTLPRALRLLRRLKGLLRRRPPDLFLPIDSPEFNLRLIAPAAAAGVPVVYFVAPQLWAWRAGRVRGMRRHVRELLALFPFEEEWFRERGVPTTYVGHPLVDAAAAHTPDPELRARLGIGDQERLGLLLPGSRRGEVHRHLPRMARAAARAARKQGRLRWVLRMAAGLGPEAYRPHLAGGDVLLCREALFDLARAADVVLAVSGTASFEAALMGTPLLVIYRLSRLSWWMARRLVRVPHVSMANLALGRPIVPELLQGDCRAERMAAELLDLLENAGRRAAMIAELRRLPRIFGAAGAYERAADRVLAQWRA